ncbi:MAG: hypothetical protein J7K26_03445 [Candidatus Aenigmarchaeota archaeon]|nr:hypothetical protein [Candidatus Aenigmarchaeota archaeon]
MKKQQNEHKIILTKKEFESYIKKGKLKIKADLFLGEDVVRHVEAPIIFKTKKNKDNIELTFAGFD